MSTNRRQSAHVPMTNPQSRPGSPSQTTTPRSGSLRRTPTPRRVSAPTTSAGEPTTPLERAATLALTASSATSTAAGCETAHAGLHATLLDDDAVIADLVRVGVDGGLVAFGRLEVDKGAIL